MRPTRYVVVVAFTIAVLILSTKLVGAQLQPQQQYGGGGGLITGSVYGFNMYNELEPIAWAPVYARSSQFSFTAYTGGGGYYQMYVPQGTYNVSVVEPGYVTYSNVVAVGPGSASSINFYLEQSHVPVPEFPSGMVSAMAVLAMAAVVVAVRRTKHRN